MHRPIPFAIVALLSSVGCYSVQPSATPTPAPGTRVELAITDAGRVQLGGSMGPEIRRVDGKFLARQDNDYVVSVTGVSYLNGIFQAWQGETVRIKPDMMAGLYEKKFSKGRTIAFAAAVGLVGAAILPNALGRSYPEEKGPPPPEIVTRILPAIRIVR